MNSVYMPSVGEKSVKKKSLQEMVPFYNQTSRQEAGEGGGQIEAETKTVNLSSLPWPRVCQALWLLPH